MEAIFSTFVGALAPLEDNDSVSEALIFAAWQKVAGRQLSERAKPVELREKRLTVNVDDEAWLVNIRSFSPQLIAGINRIVGDNIVNFIEYRCEPLRSNSTPKVEAKSSAPDTSSLSPSLLKAAEAIADPKSRELFLEAAARNLGRKAA